MAVMTECKSGGLYIHSNPNKGTTVLLLESFQGEQARGTNAFTKEAMKVPLHQLACATPLTQEDLNRLFPADEMGMNGHVSASRQMAKRQAGKPLARAVTEEAKEGYTQDEVRAASGKPTMRNASGVSKCAFIDGLIKESKWTEAQIFEKVKVEYKLEGMAEKNTKGTIKVRPGHLRRDGFTTDTPKGGIWKATK